MAKKKVSSSSSPDAKIEKKRRNTFSIIAKYFVLLSLIGASIIVIINMANAPSNELQDGLDEATKSDYVLTLSQCIGGIFAIFLPGFLEKRLKITIPSPMFIFFIVMLYAMIFLGEFGNFYYKFAFWDTIIHAANSFVIAALGYSFISILNRAENVHMKFSPLWVSVFAFFFAVTMGTFWEIYEFAFDQILGTNMQKYADSLGNGFIGHVALMDTMKDLIVDMIGAAAMCTIGYISMKLEKGWVDKMLLTRDGDSSALYQIVDQKDKTKPDTESENTAATNDGTKE